MRLSIILLSLFGVVGCNSGGSGASDVQAICPTCDVSEIPSEAPEDSIEEVVSSDHRDRAGDPYGTYLDESECQMLADYQAGDDIVIYAFDDTQASYDNDQHLTRYFRWDEDGILFIRGEDTGDTLQQYNVGYTFHPSTMISIGCYVYFVDTFNIDYEVYWNGVQLR